MSDDHREAIREAIAAELRVEVEVLHDGATVSSVGLDSLALAQSVVAVEQALHGEVDTEALSTRLAPEMTMAALIAAIGDSLVPAPTGSPAA
ncbi:MAG TPA: acyl carrier protein [Longimicrobium sp.]|jgi:acyl carrier protein